MRAPLDCNRRVCRRQIDRQPPAGRNREASPFLAEGAGPIPRGRSARLCRGTDMKLHRQPGHRRPGTNAEDFRNGR